MFDKNSILVINKSELIKAKLDNQISKLNHVLISIKHNKNINQLITKIKNNLKNKFITNEDIYITRERHREHLKNCLMSLKEFGKVGVEELLGSIFNDFCIGK